MGSAIAMRKDYSATEHRKLAKFSKDSKQSRRLLSLAAALALPFADTEAMQLHLHEISRHVATRAHAVLLLDRAGWHTTAKLNVPRNMTLILLPSRAPEFNPVEKVWQYMRQNWFSNRVFEGDAAACEAWQKLLAQPETIKSIGTRQSAHVGQSI